MKSLHSCAHRAGMFERALARPLVALIAAAWLAIFQADAIAEDKRIVRLAWSGDPTTMDPAIWGTYPDQYLMDTSTRGSPSRPSAGRGYELDLASSVDFSDPLTIKFELKPGRMWNGGFGEVTAEDVKFTYERFLSPEMRDLTAFAALKEVEITGKYSGIIHLEEPAAPIWISSFTYVIGAILSKNAYEAAGNTIPIDTRATSGAYRIKEHPAANAWFSRRIRNGPASRATTTRSGCCRSRTRTRRWPPSPPVSSTGFRSPTRTRKRRQRTDRGRLRRLPQFPRLHILGRQHDPSEPR